MFGSILNIFTQLISTNCQKEEIHVLQQEVSCMEEQLSEARLECSRLKTELVSEKSAWEITKSEMTSSINKVSTNV